MFLPPLLVLVLLLPSQAAAQAWQTGVWAGNAISGCAVAAAPEPSQAAAVARCFDKRPPPQQQPAPPLPASPFSEYKQNDGLWRDAGGGLERCLGWGNARGGGGQSKDPLLTNEAVTDIASLVRNSTRLRGTRSHCWLVRGAFDLRALQPGLLNHHPTTGTQPPKQQQQQQASSLRSNKRYASFPDRPLPDSPEVLEALRLKRTFAMVSVDGLLAAMNDDE